LRKSNLNPRSDERARIFSLIFIIAISTLSCISSSRSIDGFVVTGKADDQRIQDLARTRESWGRFFPSRAPVRIVFRHQGSSLPPAVYDSINKRIGLDSDSSPNSWRHELAHALLDLNRPNSPYWLQEGIAYFLEGLSDAACGSEASLPPWIRDRISPHDENPEIIFDKDPWDDVDLSGHDAAMDVATRATVFFFYVWQRRDLEKLIKETYKKENLKDLPLRLGWTPDWKSDLRRWLLSGNARKKLPGC